MSTDARKEEAMKRLVRQEINKHKKIMNQLDLDLITLGMCVYNAKDDGTIEYVDPNDPKFLEAYNKHKSDNKSITE